MVSQGTSALLKTLLIPPLVALALYLSITYVLLPFYRRQRERRSYSVIPQHLLPDSLLPGNSQASSPFSGNPNTAALSRLSRLVGAVAVAAHRASGGGLGVRRGSEGSMQGFGIGDEELEEGVVIAGEGDTGERRGDLVQGRLSRDLEGGFISDSSDER